MNPTVEQVTDRIRARSGPRRRACMDRVARATKAGPHRGALSCSNLAHVAAACPAADKAPLAETPTGNPGIVTAYNAMLSSHQPFDRLPDLIRQAARAAAGTAQIAGGMPPAEARMNPPSEPAATGSGSHARRMRPGPAPATSPLPRCASYSRGVKGGRQPPLLSPRNPRSARSRAERTGRRRPCATRT